MIVEARSSVGPPIIIHYHQLSFILSLSKFFMIVDDSFPCLTTRMMVHDSFPQTSAGSFKMAAKSSSRGSAAASEICVYIQDDNHDIENIEDQDNIQKISSEESVNSQELEEAQQKKQKRTTKRSSVKNGNAARLSNDLILRLIEEYEARPCLWEAILVFEFLRGKSLELAARVTLLVRLPVNYSIINYHKLLWPFDHVNDDDSLERILTKA